MGYKNIIIIKYFRKTGAKMNSFQHKKYNDKTKKVTVLIINHFPLNKGNHAILRTMIGTINQFDKNIKIVVSSYDEQLTAKRDKVESFMWPVNVKKIAEKKFIFLQVLIAITEIVNSLIILYSPRFSKKSENIYNYNKKADIILCPGGHLFTSMNPLISVWTYTISILLAKKMNKPVFGLSQTIGPFEGISGKIARYLSKKAIRNMDMIILRDKSSEDILRTFQLENINYISAGDIVYLLNNIVKKEECNFREIKQDKVNVGITIHHLYFKYHMSRREYVNIMSSFCNQLVNIFQNVNIIFIPMEYKNKDPKDRTLICEIMDSINNKENIDIVERDLQPEELLSFMKQLDFFVGTKTHSIVLSLLAGTPTLCISYHEKSNFFMHEWGVGEYAINLKNINNENLLKLFGKLSNNKKKIKTILENSRDKMKAQANKNFEIILNKLSR